MFYYLRINYYLARYFKELKKAADSPFETMKDFVIKMGSENLTKAFELTQKLQLKRHNQITLTYEQFLSDFYKSHHEFKAWIVSKFGMETYKLFLRAGGLEEKPSEAANTIKSNENNVRISYAKEIEKHLFDLGCSLTKMGLDSALTLKHDRTPIDQAISFCVGAIVENYSKNPQLMFSEHVHLNAASNKIKNYFKNGQISNFAYQSSISIIALCLKLNKTDEEKAVLKSIINQNYLGSEKLVFINLEFEEHEKNHLKDYMHKSMKEDRLKSNGLSRYEKLFIDRNLKNKSSFSSDDEKEDLINFIFNEFRSDSPITREEIRSYINERLGTGEYSLQTNATE